MKKLLVCIAATVVAGTCAKAQDAQQLAGTITGKNIAADYSLKKTDARAVPERTILLGSGGKVTRPDGSTVTCPNDGGICAVIESAAHQLNPGDLVAVTAMEADTDPFEAIVLEVRYEGDKLFGRNLVLRALQEGVKK